MTERQAIEMTYFDRAAVYRRVTAKDEDTKQTTQTEVCIAEELSCALSKNKSGELSLGGGYGQTSLSFTLFCAPDAPIAAGDKLVIVNIAGQSFTLWAGAPFSYPDSHSEIPLSAEARA